MLELPLPGSQSQVGAVGERERERTSSSVGSGNIASTARPMLSPRKNNRSVVSPHLARPQTPQGTDRTHSSSVQERTASPAPVTPVSPVSDHDNSAVVDPAPTHSTKSDKRHQTKSLEGDTNTNLIEEPVFLDGHPMQSVFDTLIEHKFVTDDCINMVLQAFNPDPTLWYVASSYMLKVGDPTSTVPSTIKEVSDLPRMLMFPLHIASAAHWALAVYDRERRHCDVFDARKDSSAAALCWKTVESLLVKHGVLKENATVDLDPFPSVRQTDNVNCGVYVLAVALHVLHGATVNSISPELWRALLAAFFSTESELPRGVVGKRLDDIAGSTASDQQAEQSIESKMGDIEATKVEELKVLSYAEQTKLLSAIVETQVRVVAKRESERQRLIDMAKWYSAVPKHVDTLMMEMVSKRKQNTVKQLKQMPRLLKGCGRRLRLLKTSCSTMAEDCSRATASLGERRSSLLKGIMKCHQALSKRLATICE